MYRWFLALLFLLGIVLTSYAHSEPKHIISVGGSITEWVVLLGAEDKLVGIDTTSLYPKKITSLPKVGYQRQLSAEGVASLKPDLLVGSSEMGPITVLQQIKDLGIEVKVLSDKPDLETLQNNLSSLGQLLNRQAKANELFQSYQNKLNQLSQAIDTARQTQATPKILLVIGLHGGLLAAGKQTSGDWLIEQAGGNNVVDFNGYKVVSNEALAALNPDIIIVADRGGSTQQALITNISKTAPALTITNAAKNNKIVLLDASLLVAGLGPRIPEEAIRLAHIFYNFPYDIAVIK